MGILFLIVFIDLVGFGIVIPLLPYYGLRFAASPLEVTTMMACYSLAQFVSSPLLGRLSDRVGRRPVLMASLSVFAAAYIWLGCATALWMVFAARALGGAGAGNIAAAQAYIADVTTPENRAKGMGLVGAAFALGFIIGPALGGLLARGGPASADLRAPAWVAAALSTVALLGVVLLLPESLPPERRGSGKKIRRIVALSAVLRRPVLSRLIVALFLIVLAFSGMESVFALWALQQFGWGPAQVAYIFAYFGLLSASLQGVLIGRLAARFGEDRLLPFGLALMCGGLAILPFPRGLPLLGIAATGLALGTGLAQPSLNSLISRHADRDEQGQVLGVSQSGGGLARVLGPIIAGALFAEFGRDAPFLCSAALVAAALVMALRLGHRPAPVRPV